METNTYEPVNYDARTGDVILLRNFDNNPSPKAFIVADTYPNKVRLSGVGDGEFGERVNHIVMVLSYDDLLEQGAAYAWKRRIVSIPKLIMGGVG